MFFIILAHETWRFLRMEESSFWFTCRSQYPSMPETSVIGGNEHRSGKALLFFAVKNKQICLFVVNACSRWPEIIHDTQPYRCPNY